jgi:glycosyltransferase involved in cell wall biosynthesis
MGTCTVSRDHPSNHTMACPNVIAHHPLVVLGVPVYNESKWIERTLRSIQAQAHTEFRVLVADNASTDGTSEICEHFARHDPRFIHFRHAENNGSSANFGFAFERSASRFFCWVGGHDLLHPEYLSRHLRALQEYPAAACSFTYFEWIDGRDRPIRREGNVGIAVPQRGAWLRYLWSVAIGSDLGPIHGLFRRNALPIPATQAVAAADLVLIANVAFRGPLLAQPGHLYKLRDFSEGRGVEDMMQRITGRSGVSGTFDATITAYLADFDRMHPTGSRASRARPIIEWLLQDRLGTRSIRLTKRLRSLIKRTHEVRSLIAPRSTDHRLAMRTLST